MKKSTKGALAAGTAAFLLLGGGGTLAYWTATADVEAGAITAGSLTITSPSCGANWTDSGGNVAVAVPGDELTKTCTFVVNGTGDNLEALLTYSVPDITTSAYNTAETTAGEKATLGVTWTWNDDSAITGNKITSADSGKTVKAVLALNIPYGTEDNATQLKNIVSATDKVTLTATQQDPNP